MHKRRHYLRHKGNQMSTSDQEQKSIYVKQNKRMAMGEKLDGKTLKTSGGTAKPKGGLSHAKKSK